MSCYLRSIAKVASLILFVANPLTAGWLERKAEGWAWYEDKIKKIEVVEEEKPDQPVSAQEQLAEVKKVLEEKLADAILNPSDESIAAYMREQQKWINQSARFSETWTKLLLKHPDLDLTIQNPVSQYGIQLKKSIDAEELTQKIAELAKDHGLFFFYQGESKISQALAKVIGYFSKRHGWEVIPISKDGVFLEDFPNSKMNNGIIERFDIQALPSIFIVNPEEKTAIPIAYGLVSVDQIEENILRQFKYLEEKR